MSTLFDFIAQSSAPKIGPLIAIWLHSPIRTTVKRTPRIVKGDMIRIENGYFADVDAGNGKWATHLILECMGTVWSTNMHVVLEDLITGEEIAIPV